MSERGWSKVFASGAVLRHNATRVVSPVSAPFGFGLGMGLGFGFGFGFGFILRFERGLGFVGRFGIGEIGTVERGDVGET